MAISLERAVEIAYRSGAIAHACHQNKMAIAGTEKQNALEMRNGEPKGSAARVDWVWYYNFWWNMVVTNQYAMNAYNAGLDKDPNQSLRYLLEDLWVNLGNAVVDLPDWDYFANLSISVGLTFTQEPPASYEANQADFTPNGDEVYNDQQPVRQRSEAFLDALTEDLWKVEATRRWLDAEVTRTGETAPNLAAWDNFISACDAAFVWTNRCEVRMVDQLKSQNNPGHGRPEHAASVAKWQYKDSGPPGQQNAMIAAGGLYALNNSQVRGVWNSRRESLPNNVRY